MIDKNKFWDHVEERLNKIEGPMYFMGATLCIDFGERNSGVAINLDGKGFVYGTGKPPYFKNDRVYVPQYITEIARRIYVEIKGRQPEDA